MKYKVRITQQLVEESRILFIFKLQHVSASLCGHYRVAIYIYICTYILTRHLITDQNITTLHKLQNCLLFIIY